jgi:hypothetical protein
MRIDRVGLRRMDIYETEMVGFESITKNQMEKSEKTGGNKENGLMPSQGVCSSSCRQ